MGVNNLPERDTTNDGKQLVLGIEVNNELIEQARGLIECGFKESVFALNNRTTFSEQYPYVFQQDGRYNMTIGTEKFTVVTPKGKYVGTILDAKGKERGYLIDNHIHEGPDDDYPDARITDKGIVQTFGSEIDIGVIY